MEHLFLVGKIGYSRVVITRLIDTTKKTTYDGNLQVSLLSFSLAMVIHQERSVCTYQMTLLSLSATHVTADWCP